MYLQRKTLQPVMILMFIINALSIEAQTFSGGEGKESSPYLISTPADLLQLAITVNGGTDYSNTYFKLANDIDLSTVCSEDGNSWTTIGIINIAYKRPFCGHFNGNNHIISNLYINTSNNYQGLFGYVSNASIDSVHLVGTNITGSHYVGSLCGTADNYSTFKYCTNSGDVRCSGSYIGGICGTATSSAISYCSNSGNVNGKSYVGGMFGKTASSGIDHSINSGNGKGSGDYVGGLCGYNSSSVLTYNLNCAQVKGTGNATGGICGYYGSTATISYCYYDKQMCTAIGGLTGKDVADKAEGKLTTNLTGETLKTAETGDGWTDDNFVFTEGLYPRPKGIENSNATIVSSTPVFLFCKSSDSYENVDSVATFFQIGTDNNIIWECINENIKISGNNAFLYLTGNDTLVAKLGNASKRVAINISAISTGRDEVLQNHIDLYPNPTISGFYIDLGNESNRIFICDSNGKLIKSEKVNGKCFIDISDFAKGTYFIRTASNKFSKIIKE